MNREDVQQTQWLQCVCDRLERLPYFNGISQFNRFQEYLAELIQEKVLEKTEQSEASTYYRCPVCGQSWVLLDPGFTASYTPAFQPILTDIISLRKEPNWIGRYAKTYLDSFMVELYYDFIQIAKPDLRCQIDHFQKSSFDTYESRLSAFHTFLTIFLEEHSQELPRAHLDLCSHWLKEATDLIVELFPNTNVEQAICLYQKWVRNDQEHREV